ncbi:MAG: enoyl-CoA hydratase/isomerase family protein [Chloroflexota bacterium]|nr:MAG: enoyl-CoA hydratase/isomerase family protein [Chloroflexota bacterium]
MSAVTAPGLRLDLDGPIATITIDRPEKLNAMTPGMLEGLESLLASIEADADIRVVVLTGAGERAFCAGADIDAWSALAPIDMWRSWVRLGHRVVDRLEGLRQPTIAALNGVAFGGGLELALACDLRIAADTVTLAAPEVGIATIPGWGMTTRLAVVAGPARAKQMILTGERIDARRAEAWGVLSEVVPTAELQDAVRRTAERIAAGAPVAVQVAKQLIDGLRPRASASLEALGSGLTAFTDDASEGRASFRERRQARFKGS